MSKLSFRARALDATKAMSIYRKDEVADLPDYSVLNRAVLQMPTGMEKEEESEHHLQRAISAQQVYGDEKVMVIPVPEAEVGVDYYNNIYKKPFRISKQYIHNQAQALNSVMEQEKPDYDMDIEDGHWVRETNKRTGLEINDIQFEEMIDRLEKSCGNQPVTLQEAKLLLKEDDDLIKAVYDYWTQKRAKSTSGALAFQVRQERRDGSSSGDSYVAFRRRTEKMQTRKNRKNDEASYEKMLKLRRDLTRAVTILEMVKRREKCKWELLHLTFEIAEKRYQMSDWNNKCLKMAKREVAIGHGNLKAITGAKIKHLSGSKGAPVANAATVVKQRILSELERAKRRISKKKEKLCLTASTTPGHSTTVTSTLPGSSIGLLSPHKHVTNVGATPKSPGISSTFTYEQAVDTMRQYEFHSSDEDTSRPKSPISGSVAPTDDRKKLPDGIYAFKRKAGCKYEAPRNDLAGDHWPWMTDDHHRYSLTTLAMPEKCVGFCRRRVGRGGRVLMDRAYTPWNRQLSEIDLHPGANHLPHNQNLQELLEEIKHGRWRRYRPYDPMTHKSRELSRKKDPVKPTSELDLKPFGHSSIASSKHSFTKDLLHKRLLQKPPQIKSPQKNRTSQKRVLVHGRQLDKPSALFAVSALVTSDSSPVQRTKVKGARSHPLKLNVMSACSLTMSNNTSAYSTPVAMTLIGNIPGTSPGKYNISNLVASPKSSPALKKKTVGRFTLDHAKFFGVNGQENVHATLMPVANLHSSSGASVTLTVTGHSPKLSLATVCGTPSSTGVVSLTVRQPTSSISNFKPMGPGGNHVIENAISASASTPQKSPNMPVVMATLRVGNSSSASSTATLHTMTTPSRSNQVEMAPTSAYSINSQSSAVVDNPAKTGTVFITPTTRAQQTTKMNVGGEARARGSVPLTANSTTLVTPQYKHAQGVFLGPQTLNLALTPSTPQKHATLSHLSYPSSSGHASAILIATPASGTLASSLPSHSSTISDGGTLSGTARNLNQAKTVSINVARVQASSSGVGHIFTLQQHHPDGNTGALTVSGAQSQGAQHSGTTWVPSGSGPNMLKIGPAGLQIHPVTAGFKVGAVNKALTVISKRPRVQQAGANTTRTINIANSKQATANNSILSGVSSQLSLIPDNRTNLATKPLISITHPQKNNGTLVLSTKNMPVIEQSCAATSESAALATPAPLSTQSGNIVSDSTGLSSKTSKSIQPMEVT